MMQLLSAWKESLQLFKPSNFKLFFLVTLKTFVGTLKVWLTYWWWLIGLVIIAPLFTKMLLGYLLPINGRWVVGYEPIFFMMGGGSTIIKGLPLAPDGLSLAMSPTNRAAHFAREINLVSFTCLLSFLYTSLYLCVRPSVAIKNWDYFIGYSKHFLYIVFWFLFVLPLMSIVYTYTNVHLIGSNSLLINGLLLVMYYVIASSTTLLYILFLLDSGRANLFSSLARAFRMVIYNLPFFTFVILSFFIFYLLLLLFIDPFNFINKMLDFKFKGFFLCIKFLEDIFFMLLLACFFVNYYIKKIHDNYSFYVGN